MQKSGTWRTLSPGEETKVLAYVAPEPEVNLFISGDLRTFGLDNRTVSVRVYEKEDGFAGILLRYRKHNYVFYTQESSFPFADISSFILKDNPTLKGVCLNGKTELIRPIVPFLSPLHLEETMMARCNELPVLPPFPRGVTVRVLANRKDFLEAYALESTITEFAASLQSEKEVVDGAIANAKRGSVNIGVFQGDLLVSLASTTADTAESAMLVGVCTREGYRQKGYASLAVGSLLQNRFQKGEKFVCLFYDNPLAGRIYHAFGFRDVASYSMLH